MLKGKSALGRTYEIKSTYPNIKVEASTVNAVNLKTINLDVKFWIEKDRVENPEKTILKLMKDCKRTLTFESGGFYNTDKFISIADYPEKMELKSPKAFVMFEFTLFPTKFLDDTMELPYLLSELADRIYKNVFEEKDFITKSKN